MATKIELKLDPLSKLKAARHLDKSGQRKFASEVKRLCDPYVPMQSGTLKNTAQVLDDGVLYDQPYASKQYYTNSGWNGIRGKQWDKRMMADKGPQLVESLAKYCGGKKA